MEVFLLALKIVAAALATCGAVLILISVVLYAWIERDPPEDW